MADLTDDAGRDAALAALLADAGEAPDVLVNAAGVFHIAACHETDLDTLDRTWAVNLRAPYALVRALLPRMLERRSGLIVNVGSVASHRAFPGNSAYSASKYGLRGFHEVLVEELRGSGVRATLLEPAATDTPLWDPLDPDADPHLPDRADMLRADDVADAVLWLCTRPANVQVPHMVIERGG
ncbi:MAG: SDR family oxidoreductase [Gemmatimonadetes bacterium]|nr:MAG: SDR family oxidoreductase [Gemmatimonadota bacterium]